MNEFEMIYQNIADIYKKVHPSQLFPLTITKVATVTVEPKPTYPEEKVSEI